MNDYQKDINTTNEIDSDLRRVKEENHFLKEEIRRLNSRLAGLNSVNPQADINSPLVEYYLNRYNEIHTYVLNNRIALLDEEIYNAEQKYDELMAKEDMLEEIAKSNQNIEERLKALDNEINQNNDILTKAQNNFQTVASEVTNLENNIYYTTMDYYNHLLSKLSIGNISEVIEYMNFLADVFKYTLYNEVEKYLKDAKSALKELEKLNVLEYEIKNNNNIYENEKKELSKGIEIISFEETEKKLDSLIYEITTKKDTRKELLELFDKLKGQNEKTIKDEIEHFQILEYTNQQIALKMDDIILGFKDKLSTTDTASNVLLNKKLLLSRLNEKMEQILPFKNYYDNLNTEYNELQAMYKTINNNIDEIESFIEESKKLKDASQNFSKVINEYRESKFKINALQENIDALLIREKNLTEARKQILNDPYGKTDLIKLDQELKALQIDINNYSIESQKLQSNIYELKQSEQNYKLISVYEEGLLCENKLPILYDKQKALGQLISDKYIEVSSAKMKCSEYESLQQQIEEVENEIANL